MKIITKEIENVFKKQGDTSELEIKNIKIIMKLFNPCGSQTWYLYERLDDDTYMAFVNLGDYEMAEIGTVSMSELLRIKNKFGLGIERDMWFKPMSMSLKEVYDTVKKGGHV